MIQRILLLGLILSVMVNGCASLSKDECANANWDAIGYGDGSHGKQASHFNEHQKACAKHGYKADFAIYKAGHQRGLQEVFCKPRNGYQLGLRGAGYDNVCPAKLEKNFLPAYQYGRNIYKKQRSRDLLKKQVVQLNGDLAKVDGRIARLKQAHNNNAANDPSRRLQKLRNDSKHAAASQERIKLTRPRAKQSKALKDHLNHEFAAQNKLVEGTIARITQKPDLSAGERQTIRKIARLSVDKGRLTSQHNWINGNRKMARPQQRKAPNLPRELQDITIKINRLKKHIHRPLAARPVKIRLEHCFRQAEYSGHVQHHNELMNHLRRPHEMLRLIDVHFSAEKENYRHRINYVRHGTPNRETPQAQQKRNRELRDAQRLRDNYLNRIAKLEVQIVNLQQKITSLKASSGY